MQIKLLFALKNWRNLNSVLSDLTEQEIDEMVNHELTTNKRRTILKRLHERRGVLRVKREWAEIENVIGAGKC